jgi:hypothetical protein
LIRSISKTPFSEAVCELSNFDPIYSPIKSTITALYFSVFSLIVPSMKTEEDSIEPTSLPPLQRIHTF